MTLEALYNLIHALSKNEIVFFRAHYLQKEANKKKDRIAVFDYLKQVKAFNKEAFKKKFKNKDLAKICKGLIDAISDYLLLYHKAQNAKQAIHLGMVKANLLEEIGLTNIAVKILENVEKIAIEIEDHYAHLSISNELVRLYAHNFSSKKIKKRQVQLSKNIHSLSKETLNFIKLREIQIKFRKRKISNFRNKQVNNILNRDEIDLINNINLFKNKNFKQSQLFFKSRYLESIGNFKESLKCSTKLLRLYEKDIKLNEFNFLGYTNTVNNIIHKLFKFGRVNEIPKLLDKFEFVKEKVNQNPLRRAHYFYRYYMSLTKFQFETGKYKLILKNEKTINNFIAELQNELPIYNTFTLWYFLGIANFYKGKYSKTKEYLNELLNHKSIKHIKPIESIAKLLDLICSTETNKTINTFVKSSKRNTNAYFKKNKFSYKTDALLLEMLNKICTAKNYTKKEKKIIFKEYLPKFKKLEKKETERLHDLGVFVYLGA